MTGVLTTSRLALRPHRPADCQWLQRLFGWVLDPDHGGRGFATEAVGAVLGQGFERHRLHRVSAQMGAGNIASAALARRVGMQQEAHLRQDWWSKGEWTDTLIFGMLATDSRS